jgi:hypothetical protein
VDEFRKRARDADHSRSKTGCSLLGNESWAGKSGKKCSHVFFGQISTFKERPNGSFGSFIFGYLSVGFSVEIPSGDFTVR